MSDRREVEITECICLYYQDHESLELSVDDVGTPASEQLDRTTVVRLRNALSAWLAGPGG